VLKSPQSKRYRAYPEPAESRSVWIACAFTAVWHRSRHGIVNSCQTKERPSKIAASLGAQAGWTGKRVHLDSAPQNAERPTQDRLGANLVYSVIYMILPSMILREVPESFGRRFTPEWEGKIMNGRIMKKTIFS